jgi:sugar lactone lactonase YvrE
MCTPGHAARFAAALLLAMTPGLASAQLTTPPLTPAQTAHLIEWDLSSIPDQFDGNPGAMVVDSRGEDQNRVWFITRVGDPAATPATAPQRIYRFDPAASLYKSAAHWVSWELHADLIAGGLKKIRPSHDRRSVFARTASFIQRIDTQNCTAGSPATALSPAVPPTCERTVFSYPDEQPLSPFVFVSDIAVDDRNRVFTTGIAPTFGAGYVQLLNTALVPSPNPDFPNQLTITAKRWPVDTGAGACVGTGSSLVCNSGIDFHPTKQNVVYFTEPGTNTIAELNVNIASPTPTSPNIRRWSLDQLGLLANDPTIKDPRTLKVDGRGRVWINTGSGHLVSLDPSTSRMSKHLLPEGASNDLFGIAPDDDVIGYTAAQTNKVGMLFPKFNAVRVTPTTDAVPPVDFPVFVTKESSPRFDGTAPADAKVVAAKTSSCDGTCVEALIDMVMFSSNPAAGPSMSPLGITANKSKAKGTFFYTVGLTGDAANPSIAKRIGFARLPNKEKIKNPRDDDDSDDGFDRTNHPGWHNSEVGDEDADGVPDQYDAPSSRENMTMGDAAPLSAGQSADYPLTASATSLALIASATADSPTAQLAVEIYNAMGVLVATSAPTPGGAAAILLAPGAGTYTARVRNMGMTSFAHTPTLVVREPALP